MTKFSGRRLLPMVLAGVLTCTCIPAYALADSESAPDPSYRQEEATDNAQSWRYGDNESSASAETEDETSDGVMALSISTYSGPTVPAWSKTANGYVNSRGEIIPNATRKGIDVSVHNGTIDWEKVKADGIDFAILRCGYGQNITSQDDKQWLRNVSECERLGIPYGVYLYSYATSPYGDGSTTNGASGEADHVLRLLEGHSPTYPVYYDLEEDTMARPLYVKVLANMATVFCDKIAAAGYTPGVYANTSWHNNYLTDPVFDNWDRWVAQYNYRCTFTGTYQLWQCTSSGAVNGITGNEGRVDLNFELGDFYGDTAKPFKWVQENGNWYYRSGSVNAKGWRNINGKRYFLGSNGVMQTGWLSYDGNWYYLDKSGAMRTEWLRLGEKWYFLDSHSGKMLTGWQTIDGKSYYFVPGNGAMVTGAQVIKGVTYHFDSSGALIEGDSNGGTTASSGTAAWYASNGEWYLRDSTGHNLTGWQKVKGTWYYLNGAGVMQTGWQKVGGAWYYLKSSGAMAVGWQKVGGAWYYLKSSGAMATGWAKVEGTWYYLKSSGAMAIGWYKVGNTWYYSNSSGAMQANRWIGNYYVTGSGAMATNTWIGRYHVDASGLWDETR